MTYVRTALFCLVALCTGRLPAAAAAPELGDRLGEHLDLVTVLFLGAIAVLVVISIVSVIRRK